MLSDLHSFFSGTHSEIRDLLLFIYKYLDGVPQFKCSEKSGIGSCRTEVDWSNFIRYIFLEDMCIVINSDFQFEGNIELHERVSSDIARNMDVEPKTLFRIGFF